MDLVASLLTKWLIYSLFLLAMGTVVLARTGYWPVGHIAFFAAGAVTTGVWTVVLGHTGVSAYLALPLGALAGGALSALPVVSLLGLRGDYFVFVSIALAEAMRVLTESVAGPGGYSGILPPPGLNGSIPLMMLALGCVSALSLWVKAVERHPLHYISDLCRTAERSALVFGIDVFAVRAKFFIVGGGLAGLSGSLFAFYSTGTDPGRFSLQEAVTLFALALIAGPGSVVGMLVASAMYVGVVFLLESILRGSLGGVAPKVSYIIFGLILMLAALSLARSDFGDGEGWGRNGGRA